MLVTAISGTHWYRLPVLLLGFANLLLFQERLDPRAESLSHLSACRSANTPIRTLTTKHLCTNALFSPPAHSFLLMFPAYLASRDLLVSSKATVKANLNGDLLVMQRHTMCGLPMCLVRQVRDQTDISSSPSKVNHDDSWFFGRRDSFAPYGAFLVSGHTFSDSGACYISKRARSFSRKGSRLYSAPKLTVTLHFAYRYITH